MQYVALLNDVQKHVCRLFKDNYNENLVYHNIGHTKKVVAHAAEIAATYSLNTEELFVILAAAWFHDVGHLFVPAKHHEEESVAKMKQYFEAKNTDTLLIEKIAACINATKYPPKPKSISDEIICDADTYNFGTPEFKITDEQVHAEIELTCKTHVNKWHNGSLFLLTHHHFFTSYCEKKLHEGKEQNIKYLLSLIVKNE